MRKGEKEERFGYQISRKFLSGRFSITESYERTEKGWKPKKPDFEKLVGQWIIIEPDILSFEEPVLCLVEDDEGVIIDSSGLPVKIFIDSRTLELEESIDLSPEWIWKLHVLEPPVVTEAKSIIEAVESEKLGRSPTPYIALRAYTILKLKQEVTQTRVAELIEYLMDKIEMPEEEQPVIPGEKLAGGPNKKKQKPDELVKDETIKEWLEYWEKYDGEPVMSVEDMMNEIRKKSESRNSRLANQFRDWTQILYSKHDKIVEAVIREIYYDAEVL